MRFPPALAPRIRHRTALPALCLCFCFFFGAAAHAGGLRAIEVVVTDKDNPFFAKIGRSANEYAGLVTNQQAKVNLAFSGFDAQRQATQIAEAAARKPDVILLTPMASPLVVAAVKSAKRGGGVRLIAMDAPVDGADLTIATDNVEAGRQVCQFLAERIGGKGTVAIIDGPQVSAISDRVQGCKAALSRFPMVLLVPDMPDGKASKEGGAERMTELLLKYPKLDALFAINDPTAIGAEQSIRQARRPGIVIGSVDGAPAIEERLRDPASLIEASAAQFPDRMAGQAVVEAVSLQAGKVPASPRLLIAPKLITKSNIGTYHGWRD
ncbi:substrate-binding domain-containing protein [Variovorax sp. ZS18.2.2]|uniref:substrate-binding domain-containing protein n=1 Tax=Variovorax sp. ZS18.2.2 TaxID=2971255 RepID=UPI002150B907|nr:substrate-binding domain-containing protein [Variovorax sp. ZS18.2.2]MCR6476916.1 substrate-binding domain-containing protein [Variovorax sp. ZS18.2.2]